MNKYKSDNRAYRRNDSSLVTRLEGTWRKELEEAGWDVVFADVSALGTNLRYRNLQGEM